MTRRALVSTSALLLAALASAPTAAAASKAPVVKSISPMKVTVGEKLTLRGKNFVPGKGKTRVFFVRVKGRGVASAAAVTGSKTRVVVTVPAILNGTLAGKSARFKVRVLGKSFSKWTAPKKSPVISPSAGGSTDGGGGAQADCDRDGAANGVDVDDDNDLLTDEHEKGIGTDACAADSDSDGMEDGYEYQSALDLNRTVLLGSREPLPYPGKRPYPNPLFPDSDIDYDGDGLRQLDEFGLWIKYGGHQFPLNYSDGLQTTVPTPLPPGIELKQMDTAAGGPAFNDGWLNDSERDADGDNLTNWDETNGRMTPGWWAAKYDGENGPKEKPYPFVTYASTDPADRDSDGDGLHDGIDDVDHDGLTNQYEVRRPYDWPSTYISTLDGVTPIAPAGTNPWARVNPFNPCKPVYSPTCHTHAPFGYYEDEDWMGLYPDAAVAGYGGPGPVPGPPVP
jgi:hypothetical protein